MLFARSLLRTEAIVGGVIGNVTRAFVGFVKIWNIVG
jgi:hypothetical protein